MLDVAREFRVLATHLNFTTAARELNESQSALSRHIADLEKSLGFVLLERSPVRLTAAGDQFLNGISGIIENFDGLVSRCLETSRLDHMSLVLSFVRGTEPVSFMVYDVLSQMSAEYPNFEYSFDSNRKLTTRQAIETKTADFGIVYHFPKDLASGIRLVHAYDEPFSVWMHRSNPLADRDNISFSDLSSCVIVLSANRKFSTWVEGMQQACERYKCTPSSYRTKDLDSLEDFFMSIRDNEVVFASSNYCNVEMLNPRLKRVDIMFESARPTYPVNLLWNEREFKPALQRFLFLFGNAIENRCGTRPDGL